MNTAIQRARDADISIQETRSQAERQVAEYRQQAEVAEQARSEAEARVEAALKAQSQAERQLANGRADNAEALKKARADVTDKQNKLKAISKALADTPENVVRKLKTLKKQKLDESKLRGQAEAKLQSARKEKSRLEQQVESQTAELKTAAQWLEQLRQLHQVCTQAEATIKQLSDKQADQIAVPDIDAAALDALLESLGKQ